MQPANCWLLLKCAEGGQEEEEEERKWMRGEEGQLKASPPPPPGGGRSCVGEVRHAAEALVSLQKLG